MAETSILDGKSYRIFGHPLTITQQIWIGFVVPAMITTIIFMIKFALDIAVVFQLFKVGLSLQAYATLVLAYAPALVCLISTLRKSPKLENVCDLFLWVLLQILQFALFPIGIIHRLATRLFWSTVALTSQNIEREAALQQAALAHQVDFFFFLNSLLNAAPQAVLQAYFLLSEDTFTSTETAWTEAMNMLISVTTLSTTVALYQRFESQRAAGRPKAWKLKCDEVHSRALLNLKKIDTYFLMGLGRAQEKQLNITTSDKGSKSNHSPEANEVGKEATTGSPEHSELRENLICSSPAQEEDTPINSNTVQVFINHNSDADNEIITVPDEQQSLLGTPGVNIPPNPSTTETSQHFESIERERRDEAEEASCTATETAEPEISTANQDISLQTSEGISLPLRKPRSKGLNEDEPLGLFTVFNAWSGFLMARVLALAALIHFYPWPSFGLILVHYTIMVTYISFCNPCPNFWAPLLGLIYILCPIEVKVRYKFPRYFLTLFFCLTVLEDLSTATLWYFVAEWEIWWYDWAYFVIISGHCLATLNAGLYVFIFKPKITYVAPKP